jgi:hypothetical protein
LQQIIEQNHAYTDQHIKYVRHDLRAGIVYDLWFLDNNDRMKTAIGLIKFVLKATTLTDEGVDEPW